MGCLRARMSMYLLSSNVWWAAHSFLLLFTRFCLGFFFFFLFLLFTRWNEVCLSKHPVPLFTLTWFWKQQVPLFGLLKRALNQMLRWLGFLEDILFSDETRDAWSRSFWQEATGPIAAHVLTHVIDLTFPIFVQRASYFRIWLLIVLLCITQTNLASLGCVCGWAIR